MAATNSMARSGVVATWRKSGDGERGIKRGGGVVVTWATRWQAAVADNLASYRQLWQSELASAGSGVTYKHNATSYCSRHHKRASHLACQTASPSRRLCSLSISLAWRAADACRHSLRHIKRSSSPHSLCARARAWRYHNKHIAAAVASNNDEMAYRAV